MKNSEPKITELDYQQLEAQLDQIATAMGEETARPFRCRNDTLVDRLRQIRYRCLVFRSDFHADLVFPLCPMAYYSESVR